MKNKLLALEYHYVSDSPEKPIFVCFFSEVLHVTMRAPLLLFQGRERGRRIKVTAQPRFCAVWVWRVALGFCGSGGGVFPACFSVGLFSVLVGLRVFFGSSFVCSVFLSFLIPTKFVEILWLSIASVSK